MSAQRVHRRKTDEQKLEDRIVRLQKKLAEEKELRLLAERNAQRFHAMLLKARIELINAKGTP